MFHFFSFFFFPCVFISRGVWETGRADNLRMGAFGGADYMGSITLGHCCLLLFFSSTRKTKECLGWKFGVFSFSRSYMIAFGKVGSEVGMGMGMGSTAAKEAAIFLPDKQTNPLVVYIYQQEHAFNVNPVPRRRMKERLGSMGM